MVPGTRLAFGIRLGRPAVVDPAEDGELATLAARQPASAGDDQRLPAADVLLGKVGAPRPSLNQLDSTALKTGSLCSPPRSAEGGMMTLSPAELVSWLRDMSGPPARFPPVMPPTDAFLRSWSG
jgi:hypothetical protein